MERVFLRDIIQKSWIASNGNSNWIQKSFSFLSFFFEKSCFHLSAEENILRVYEADILPLFLFQVPPTLFCDTQNNNSNNNFSIVAKKKGQKWICDWNRKPFQKKRTKMNLNTFISNGAQKFYFYHVLFLLCDIAAWMEISWYENERNVGRYDVGEIFLLSSSSKEVRNMDIKMLMFSC